MSADCGPAAAPRPRVGVSSCLLGERVRYDGGHKRDPFLAERLARHVDFVPRCPEIAIGLGAPREPIRLVRQGDGVEARGVHTGLEAGPRLCAYADEQAALLAGLSGYVFKSKSPSCGVRRVPWYRPAGGRIGGYVRGLYAERIATALPWLPIEDEDRLSDPGRRDSFLVRIFTLHRLQRAFAHSPAARVLVDFHSDHKLLLLAHNVAAYRRLGRLVAGADRTAPAALPATYRNELMRALRRPASVPGHVNALQHLAGYLRASLDTVERHALAREIDAYGAGEVSWAAVCALLREHFRRYPHPWVARQVYFAPYPEELAAPAPEPESA